MDINYFFEETEEITISKNIKYWIVNTINNENKQTGNINIIFCSDEYLLKMNKKHLKHDFFTDIITFDYGEQDVISGDLFISIDRVKDNAIKFNVEFLNELQRVIIHGVLHLIGFNDKTEEEKKEMRKKENFYLAKLEKEKDS